ncbi:MAG: NFACT RNA binding domain-containing protein [Sulfurovaceae bacterium]|nr:NFACT RNA binding domain-containing protein [Sulfurovaceae bacterium]
MKYGELIALQKHLMQFDTIFKAKRIGDNIISLRFDKEFEYGFMMTRGESMVYRAKQTPYSQNYNAPFDNLLESLVSYSKIIDINVLPNDRVLRMVLQTKNSYKTQTITLQFEFTGRHTNVILLDENEIIIEALRHIDAGKSFRVIRPGVELLGLPPRKQNMTSDDENIEEILEKNYRAIQTQALSNIKQNLIGSTEKKYNKLYKLLSSLPSETALQEECEKYNLYGSIILANLHNIKAYDTEIKTLDFEGNNIVIDLPKHISTNRIGDYFFTMSKKAKNKAIHIHIERENLESKVSFYKTLLGLINNATSTEQLMPFMPQKSQQKKEKKKSDDAQIVWIEGYKVLIGRNKKENKKLLTLAKANDIWMHIQGIPSSHVIIKTDKQSIPQSVIRDAAKLCVDFSTDKAGEYKVDFTKRKFVKPQEEANVFYTNYETIIVTKEGIEIRS